MREVPDCMTRRYQALDGLIQELTAMMSTRSSNTDSTDCGINTSNSDAGIKLMCQFWNILKEDPDCNLPEAVQERMGVKTNNNTTGFFRPQRYSCYMANSDKNIKKKEAVDKIKNLCCTQQGENSPMPKCCSKLNSPCSDETLPLSKVLCSLKEAASFDKKCSTRLNELMQTQKQLQDQIAILEEREKNGIKLLKQADCMWSCMEDAYKKKLAESAEHQKILTSRLKEVETSNTKWRKNKKDLQMQMESIKKCQLEMTEKMNQKKNDLKCMETDIADLTKRIDNNKNDIEVTKRSLTTKKQTSDIKILNITTEVTKLQKLISEEHKEKTTKEKEGAKYVKDAREDLQKICRVLLQKKLETEDLLAEKDAILNEIELLNKAADLCKDKCKNKQENIVEEIKKIEKEIADFKVKCIRCHQCNDTADVRKFCTDCPKCLEERDCLLEKDHCVLDHTMDCVCVSVKQKFLDNVFDNMYTVLEKQAKLGPGKAVADAILNCLKRSRNGKLTDETKKILQDFILTTVKKNLNLTIIGGAVKTRCELDQDTYKQLMECLKQVKAVAPPKEDKGTVVKKEACHRWGGTSECNCPKGPKECICNRKAPPPPKSSAPIPPPEKEDMVLMKPVTCPHKENTSCGPDCAMHGLPSAVGTDVAAYRPDPCQGPTCTFSKNMRAAQCMLGPESLSSLSKIKPTKLPLVPNIVDMDNELTCKCGDMPTKICKCHKDTKCCPRERIIEEVMGRYTEVTPIEKVTTFDDGATDKERKNKGSYASMGTNNRIESAEANETIRNIRNNVPLYCVSSQNKNRHVKTQKVYKSQYEKPISSEVIKVDESFHEMFRLKENDKKLLTNRNNNVAIKLMSQNESQSQSSRKINESESQSSNTVKSTLERTDFISEVLKKSGHSKTVDEFMKEIIVPHVLTETNDECMTLDALFKEMYSKSKLLKDSNTTINEEEVKHESLEANLKNNDVLDTDLESMLPVTTYIKQLKADFVNENDIDPRCYCETNTRLLTQRPSYENNKNELRSVLYDKHDPEHQKKIVETSDIISNTKSVAYEKYSEETGELVNSPNKFKVSIQIDSKHSFDQLTEITSTGSGTLVMALDEKVIEEIEKWTKDDPSINICLKKTTSGHYLLNFKPLKYLSDHYQKVSVKRTPSGNTYLEVQKKIVRTIQPGTVTSSDKASQNILTQTSEVKKTENDVDELPQKQTMLGSNDENKLDISVTKNDEKTYDRSTIVKVGKPKLEETVQKNPLENDIKKLDPNFSKVKVKGIQEDMMELPALLKLTASHNFIIVFYKEFEISYREFIEEFLTDSGECSIGLAKTRSDSYVIDFDEDGEPLPRTQNALLIKSPSGDLKVLVNGPYFEKANSLVKRKSISPYDMRNSTKAFQELLSELHSPTYESLPKKTKSQRVRPCMSKSSSDSQIYKRVKVKFEDHKGLLAEPSATLTKSPSGKYAVVLNKDSKKSFINNLKSFLADNSNGFIPVRRTESGEIIIDLNNSNDKNNQRGSLKISPSGNIYILVDEKIVEGMSSSFTDEDSELSSEISDMNSAHMISKIKNPANKAVATTCEGKPGQSCCNTKACVCRELNANDWMLDSPEKNVSATVIRAECSDVADVDANCTCHHNVNVKKLNNDRVSNQKKIDFNGTVTPHITIKPCGCRPVLQVDPKTSEQCYYLVQSICPYHKDRYDSVSNDLIEISSLCNEQAALKDVEIKKIKKKKVKEAKPKKRNNTARDWDALDYLPPQLPSFLRNNFIPSV